METTVTFSTPRNHFRILPLTEAVKWKRIFTCQLTHRKMKHQRIFQAHKQIGYESGNNIDRRLNSTKKRKLVKTNHYLNF